MKTIFACMIALAALPAAAQQGAAPAPATPRGIPTAPGGPGSANNPAAIAQPSPTGRTFAIPTAATQAAIDPATGLPATGVVPTTGGAGFPPPGTQVINPGVAISRQPRSGLGGVLVTPNGVIPIPAQGGLSTTHPRFSGTGSSLGSATAASPLGSAVAGSTLGNTLGAGSGLGSATGGPGLGGNVPPSAAGTAPGAVTGFGAATAGANVGGTAPSLAGSTAALPGGTGLGTSVIGSGLGAVNPLGNTFGGQVNPNGIATPGSVSGQGTPASILPATPSGTNGTGAAAGRQIIQVPVPVYITSPEQFVPQPAEEELLPRTVVPPAPRITPRSATRTLRRLPPPVTPPPPSPR